MRATLIQSLDDRGRQCSCTSLRSRTSHRPARRRTESQIRSPDLFGSLPRLVLRNVTVSDLSDSVQLRIAADIALGLPDIRCRAVDHRRRCPRDRPEVVAQFLPRWPEFAPRRSRQLHFPQPDAGDGTADAPDLALHSWHTGSPPPHTEQHAQKQLSVVLGPAGCAPGDAGTVTAYYPLSFLQVKRPQPWPHRSRITPAKPRTVARDSAATMPRSRASVERPRSRRHRRMAVPCLTPALPRTDRRRPGNVDR